MAVALVGVGANLGSPLQSIQQAIDLLASAPSVESVVSSEVFSTLPIGGPAGQDVYTNAALRMETSLGPHQLLDFFQAIEQQLGRERTRRWDARIIDLDLLLYDKQICNDERLTIPHPRMACRRFVLEPAVQVASEMIDPQTGWTIEQLWKHLNDAPPYFALSRGHNSLGEMTTLTGERKLAEDVAAAVGAKLIRSPRREGELSRAKDQSRQELLQAIRQSIADQAELLLESVSTTTLTVSDFWFGDILEELRPSLGEEIQDELIAEWSGHNERLIQPKLLAILNPIPKNHPQTIRRERSLPSEALAPHASRLTSLATPRLVIEPGDTEWEAEQWIAAIEGMR